MLPSRGACVRALICGILLQAVGCRDNSAGPSPQPPSTLSGLVFALGDTTNLPISKAGSTAHFEAEALSENIAAQVKLGAPVRDYDGKVFCFIEAGKDRATYAMFNYLNPPDPKAPTRAVHWFKMAYNKLYWISARGLL